MRKQTTTKSTMPVILTVNGGSSSIKFALFAASRALPRILSGKIDAIGQPRSTFQAKGVAPADTFSRPVKTPNHTAAVSVLMDWISTRFRRDELAAVGHRVVHGGPKYWQPQRITPKMLQTLRQLSPFDPEHLPEEILLAEAFQKRFPKLPQVACFDTAFHHALPTVARLLPLPRRFYTKGVRRYGFHGLSCEYLMQELRCVADAQAARGRVILAHLGNGASATAVLHGKSMDTSMSFTPAAGLPMSTRSGDLDPGLAWYLARTENLTARQFNQMVNHESGLLGVSGTSSDMQVLLSLARRDVRAAEAVNLFCYQAKKWICALAGVLGGLDTLVFSGGIGENSPEIRSRICRGLEFTGIEFDPAKNRATRPVISRAGSPATVRVIRTDEESVIAQSVRQILKTTIARK
jgi:acetate kinase